MSTPPSPPIPTSKKRRLSPPSDDTEETTDTKLALLLSLHPKTSLETLLEALLSNNGSVSAASNSLSEPSTKKPNAQPKNQPRKQSLISPLPTPPPRIPLLSFSTSRPSTARQQSSLTRFLSSPTSIISHRPPAKGQTQHFFTPLSIPATIPVELQTSFLPPSLASSLLSELLQESTTFPPPTPFRLFDRNVVSPHTCGFFLRDPTNEARSHAKAYLSYQAIPLASRPYTPSMLRATEMVEEAVNAAISRRFPGKKPWGLTKEPWRTNAALVNRYHGPKEAVGWHTDEVTYLGPMAVIAGLSLGVEREFRVRRMMPGDGKSVEGKVEEKEGQYSIHLPHNSLIIMHPGMQEGWKHCVHPTTKVDMHPTAGETRINITYRCYRESLRPGVTPKCKCKLPMSLRAVFDPEPDPDVPRRYFWNCNSAYLADGDGTGCGYFKWAQFTEDGEPIWVT
ncbi:GRF zinc finger domain-containing protein [Pyronema domesticum]|nr:GRF zinc finger domain-containing protein [Pyronema domesticum]